MKRFYFDQKHRQFSQETFSQYDPEAVKEMLASLAWQEELELPSDFSEQFSEEDLGLPKNLTTPDARFFPKDYEPNYAYPLIIWITDGEESSTDFQDLMPRISDRNYLGLEISIRQLSHPHENQSEETNRLGLSGICCDQLLSHIQEELVQFNQQANIHPDRIYLAGSGACASLAIQLNLMHPLQFAGFLAINPVNQGLEHPLANFRFLKHLRGLLTTTGTAATDCDNEWAKPFSQLLHDAGIQLHLDTQRKTESKAYSLINRIVMQSIWDSDSNQ